MDTRTHTPMWLSLEDASKTVGMTMPALRRHIRKQNKARKDTVRTKTKPTTGRGRPLLQIHFRGLVKTLRRPNDPTDMGVFYTGKGDAVRKKEARRSVSVKVEKVTPKKAAEWLDVDVNTHNRQPTRGVVERYTRHMREDRWMLSPDCVAFDKNGNLFNGQHRLRAVVNSNKTVQFIVARGMEVETYYWVDMPKVRNYKDPLGIKGFDRSKDLAPMIKWIVGIQRIERGEISARYPDRLSPQTFPVEDMLAFAVEHRDSLYDSLGKVPHSASKCLNKTMLRALHWIYSQQDKGLADDFIHALVKGIDWPLGGQTDPVYRLRKSFESAFEKGHKLKPRFPLAWSNKAWSLLKAGNKGAGRGNTRGMFTYKDDEAWPFIGLYPQKERDKTRAVRAKTAKGTKRAKAA